MIVAEQRRQDTCRKIAGICTIANEGQDREAEVEVETAKVIEAGDAHLLTEEIAEEASVETTVEENLVIVVLYVSQNPLNLQPNLIAKEEDLLLIALEEVEVAVPQAVVVSILGEEGDAILPAEVVLLLLPILEEGPGATVDPVEVHTVHHADHPDLLLTAHILGHVLDQNPTIGRDLPHHLQLRRKLRKPEVSTTHY